MPREPYVRISQLVPSVAGSKFRCRRLDRSYYRANTLGGDCAERRVNGEALTFWGGSLLPVDYSGIGLPFVSGRNHGTISPTT